MNKLFLLSSFLLPLTVQAQTLHLGMDGHDQDLTVTGLHMHYVNGLNGQALRTDGYSSYATVPQGVLSSITGNQLSVSVDFALQSYPIINANEFQEGMATLIGNYNATEKKGLDLRISSTGKYAFYVGIGGWEFFVEATDDRVPTQQWTNLTAVMDLDNRTAKLYRDGVEKASKRCTLKGLQLVTDNTQGNIYIGMSQQPVMDGSGLFALNTINGIIDDINIYSDVHVGEAPSQSAAAPDFQLPASHYEADLWRPAFHAQPSSNWMNESHGLIYSDGRWHLFFQKNANGPYWGRLMWGHVTSDDLCSWREEPIAIETGAPYDIKGCWSGCLYTMNGVQHAFYTGVDNGAARIIDATATDASLNTWKKLGIVVNGRPTTMGLSDDFRDPFVFSSGGNTYMIVGTSNSSKVGACVLYKYNGSAWTLQPNFFFQGTNATVAGTFWEMPNVTKMGDKWLFTVTPQGTGSGVRTIYWLGTIADDGTFTPDSNTPATLELTGMSRDGYGLLSPTICPTQSASSPSPLTSHLLLGIVPDKLATQHNYNMGWAHLFSLPRQISLNAAGQLVQQPYSGLKAMRSSQNSQFSILNSQFTQSLAPVSGRQIEMLGQWTVASGQMGFRFLQQGDRCASLTYDADLGTLTLDLSRLDRIVNDQNVYNGIYKATLPEKPAVGETLQLHVFLDGSILDVFVSDRWAFSVRLFPTNAEQVEAEAFSTAATSTNIKAWTLDPRLATGITTHPQPLPVREGGDKLYNLSGQRLEQQPRSGICIRGGKKMICK